MSEPIAIIGLACRFPGARSADEFWRNLAAGVESIRRFSQQELAAAGVEPALYEHPDYVPASGFLADVDQFDPAFFDLSLREAQITDPQHRLFLECAWEALEDAGRAAAERRGPTGCFAGAGMSLYSGAKMNTYFSRYVLPDQELLATLDGPQVIIANRHEYLPTRVSYKLDLRGPSVNVQTACSTSLVAVHLACRSILDGECEMALAGAAAVHMPVVAGYVYNEGGMLSPDGRCRAFDAASRGTVGGSGCGVVLLKRLDRALADGDRIRAVIRGSAINNDGRDKVSYTAPSVGQQAAVISAALRAAGISADTIGYVEAHGTGTALGDPIEVAALTQAYRADTMRIGYCAIGSVKTNVGHLDSAAGMPGLIKAVLALENGLIPPSLHFEQPNPSVELAGSPFFVCARPTPWPEAGAPRRAGVSSLGAGGTNAHIILEEAPARAAEAVSPDRDAHVLVLSARTAPALTALAARVGERLIGDGAPRLADAAFALNTGRAAFRHRLAVVAATGEEAAAQLRAFAASGQAPPEEDADLATHVAATGERGRVAFLACGQGTQHVGMGRQLRADEPAFAEALDRAAAACDPHLPRPLLDVMFGGPAELLADTCWAQPALFALSCALAAMWERWGVSPSAVGGHSIGEYAAAVSASVLSLDDAARLVCARSRLMSALPAGGAMWAVFAGEEAAGEVIARVARRTGGALAVAVVNGPAAVVLSGERGAVEEAAAELRAAGVDGRALRVSHAFHSPLMDPVLPAFEREVRRVRFAPPRVPFYSTVTGRLAGAEIAAPEYWIEQIRRPVRFAAVVAAISGARIRTAIELGPDATMRGMAEDVVAPPAFAVLPSAARDAAWRSLLRSAGRLFVRGGSLDWERVDARRDRRRVAMPTYPFQRQRVWVDPPAQPAAATPALGDTGALLGALARDPSLSDEERRVAPRILAALARLSRGERAAEPAAGAPTYRATWVDASRPVDAPARPGTWLVLSDDRRGPELAVRLAARGHRVTLVRVAGTASATTAWIAPGVSSPAPIDPTSHDALAAILAGLGHDDVHGIVDLWPLCAPPLVEDVAGDPAGDAAAGLGGLAALVRALARSERAAYPPLWVVTERGQPAADGDPVDPRASAVSGMMRTLALEFPDWPIASVDLEPDANAGDLVAELDATGGEPLVAYRRGRRLVARLEPVASVAAASAGRLPSDGAYLVTGGTGGLGIELAGWLAGRGARHLVLAARGRPDARAERAIDRLRACGVEVDVVQADLARRADAAQLVGGLRRPLRGVFHLAGVLDDAPLADLGWDRLAPVLAGKAAGAWHLHELTRSQPLVAFVLFSSAAALLGSPGQAGYAAANAFLDGLAARRAQCGLPALSVAWGPWAEVGMAAELERRLDGRGPRRNRITPLAPADALAHLDRLLGGGAPAVAVLPVDAELAAGLFGELAARPIDQIARAVWRSAASVAARPSAAGNRASPAVSLHGEPRPRRVEALRAELRTQLARVTGQEPASLSDIDRSFRDHGVDSLMALQLRNGIVATLGLRLPATILFRYSTVRQLADHLADRLEGAPEPPRRAARAPEPPLGSLGEDALAELLARELREGVS